MSNFDISAYVTVAERLAAFYEKYPDGSIQSDIIELSEKRVVMRSTVYRTAADERPSIAHSSLAIPGSTPYTRGSEIENAETSAAGRAIAMMGFEVKRGIATAEEVQNKQGETERPETTTTHDGSLIGIAEVGKAGSGADFELRQGPEGPVAAFRLKQGRSGFKVVAHGALALDLAAMKPEGQQVKVWGSMQPESYTPAGATRAITYNIVNLERMEGPDFTIPAVSVVPSGSEAPTMAAFAEFSEEEQAAILADELASVS